MYKTLNTPKKLADSIINLQRTQAQSYQTVIKISVTPVNKDEQSGKNIYNLYLKTSNDFTYFVDKSDEPLNRLCTVLKNSQTDNIFIPLDLAVAEDGSISQALLQVQDFTSTELRLKVLIGGDLYIVEKSDILEIQSTATYY